MLVLVGFFIFYQGIEFEDVDLEEIEDNEIINFCGTVDDFRFNIKGSLIGLDNGLSLFCDCGDGYFYVGDRICGKGVFDKYYNNLEVIYLDETKN